MSKILDKVKLEERRKMFGDLDDEILKHIGDDGVVWFTVVDGKRVYGLPDGVRTINSPVLHHEQYFGKSLTQQQFHDEVSIQHILKKYNVGPNYIPEEVQIPVEFFKDCTLSPKDYTEFHNMMQEVNAQFMELPAELRRAVNDDPRRLLELSQSEKGLKTLIALGFGKEAIEPILASEGSESPSGGKAKAVAKEPENS